VSSHFAGRFRLHGVDSPVRHNGYGNSNSSGNGNGTHAQPYTANGHSNGDGHSNGKNSGTGMYHCTQCGLPSGTELLVRSGALFP
jgi:hypothetical protein